MAGSRLETGVLIAGVVAAPFAVHQLYKLHSPAFMQAARVEACAGFLPEEGVRQVGKLAVECKEFAGAFPRVVVKEGETYAYEPKANPIMSGSNEVPEPGYEGVTSVSFTLISRSKFKTEAKLAADTYKGDHNFSNDIFGGFAAVGILYGLASFIRRRPDDANSEDGRAGSVPPVHA